MRNNNGAIVVKLARRTLKANKRRNFFIATAIALTAFMMASVFSIGISYYDSINLMPFRSEGMHSHMGFSNSSSEQLYRLSNLNYVTHFGTHHIVGMAQLQGFESEITMVYADETHWLHLQVPAFTHVVGQYAVAENEIMLSRAKLAQMGINEPYIGMLIPASFTIYGTETLHTHDFILSAMYTEFVSAHAGAFTPVFVSQAFAERHTRISYEHMNVNLLFRSQTRAAEYMERLVQDLSISENQPYALHPALLFYSGANIAIMYIAMGCIIAFLMFTGFLLIYNVMYISVSKDVRFYGLLKTLGTTPRQLSRLIYGQVLSLYIYALPIGLIFAALTSLMIVPAFLSDINTGAVVSFSPTIYLGGALFALLTVILGAYTSAKKTARISPIEAIKFTGEIKAHIKRRISAKGKPFRMAWRNVFRERKRAMIVLLSLFMGITVFTMAMTVVSSFDIDSEMDAWYTHDFVISTLDLELLDDSFVAQVASIHGVTEVQEQTATFGRIIEPEVRGSIRGFETAWLLAIDPTLADTLDLDAFERGEVVLVNHLSIPGEEPPDLPPLLQLEIADIELPFTVALGGTIDRVSTIGGVWWNFGGGLNILMSNTFLRQQLEDLDTVHLGVNVQPGMDEVVHSYLTELLGLRRSSVSRFEARQSMEEGLLMITVLGVGLSAILGVIGIFNFVNVMSVGLLTRKREFAILESVGMSKRQLHTMIGCEGIIYWILTITASVTLGTALSYSLISMLMNVAETQFPRFVYPLIPIMSVYIIVILVCSIAPEVAYKSMSKLSLVERLREVE